MSQNYNDSKLNCLTSDEYADSENIRFLHSLESCDQQVCFLLFRHLFDFTSWIIVVAINFFYILLLSSLGGVSVFWLIEFIFIGEVGATEYYSCQETRETSVRLLVKNSPVFVVIGKVTCGQVIFQNYNSREKHAE